ncbi:hypothetical protein SESBI_42931 [Sesbania bispinosa]|nr:hypothetical protein SESBI_42931 [Sesbania bispinosa]
MNFGGDAVQLLRTTTEMRWCSLTVSDRDKVVRPSFSITATDLQLRHVGAVRLLQERDDEHAAEARWFCLVLCERYRLVVETRRCNPGAVGLLHGGVVASVL